MTSRIGKRATKRIDKTACDMIHLGGRERERTNIWRWVTVMKCREALGSVRRLYGRGDLSNGGSPRTAEYLKHVLEPDPAGRRPCRMSLGPVNLIASGTEDNNIF
jgi:hypothetical protein